MKKLFLYFKFILIVVITILIFGIIFILNPIIVDKSNEITLIANAGYEFDPNATVVYKGKEVAKSDIKTRTTKEIVFKVLAD